MRRGRPTASPAPTQASQHQRPSAKPTEGDPFAALDSKSPRPGEPDEFSSRFPSLDQFSLLHDQGTFDFDSTPATQKNDGYGQKATNRLADEVFASSRSPPSGGVGSRPQSVAPAQAASRVVSQHIEALSKTSSGPPKQDVSRAQSIISSNPDLQAISAQTTAKYVSTGTSTSDLPFEQPVRASYRVSKIQAAEPPRSSSLPRQPSDTVHQDQSGDTRSSVNARVSSLQSQPAHTRAGSATREPPEIIRPQEDLMDTAPRNTLTVNQPPPRPQSTNFETTSSLDYLREREALSRPHSRLSPRHSPQVPSPNLIPTDDEPQPETNDLDFLRNMENSDSKTKKRSSIGSLSGSKNMLSTKFGDAFKRFEGSQSSSGKTPSPLKEHDRRDLEPVAGSETIDGRSDDGKIQEDEGDMTPEMRRELERRKLEEEEQRVEAAQAEYRKRVAAGGSSATGPSTAPKPGGGPTRAMTIQNRVQSLLDEQRTTNVPKTAQGYGKYSDAASTASKQEKALPEIPRKPIPGSKPPSKAPYPTGRSNTGLSAPPALPSKPAAKPVAPKKPVHLNSLPTSHRPSSPTRTSQSPATEQLIAVDLPGQPTLDITAQEKDNYLEEFSQRFPSLSAMEGERPNGGGR